MRSQCARALLASAVTAGVVLLPWLGAALVEGVAQRSVQPPQEVTSAALEPKASSEGDVTLQRYVPFDESVVMTLFERVGGNHSPSSVPSWFAREVLDPAQLKDAQTYCATSVVGIGWTAWERDAGEVVAHMLAQNGWTRCGVTEAGEAYLKEAGTCRWIHVQVRQVNEHASVTVVFERGVE